MAMHTFYYRHHEKHDPAWLHHADTPDKNRYYSEVAQRGHVIHDALKKAALGPISQPGDFGLDPIAEIHEYEMITLLQTAYERMLQEEKQGVALPETFSVGHRPHRRSLSIWGQLGSACFDTSSPIFEHTWEAAYWSAQTAVSAAALLLAGGERVTYALCRPPGHHAMRSMFGGFCYLNNAAVAANWLAQQGKRVAILDIDYHHGNGTQDIFYGRSDVLFCSIHADPLYEYPYYWGYADEFGSGHGENYTFNFPLPLKTGERRYMEAFDAALHKIRLFVPDTLIVSLGVDTFIGDPVGGFQLTTDTFTRLGAKIAAFDLPTAVIQEGGYLLNHLGSNVVAFLGAMVG